MTYDYSTAITKLISSNDTITAVTIVNGAGNIIYQTSNWDITSDVISVLNAWRKQEPSIIVQGIKYSTLQCTQERLVATNIMGQGHIVCANFKDAVITIAYITPDGGAGIAYMDIARINDAMASGTTITEAKLPQVAPTPTIETSRPQVQEPTYQQTPEIPQSHGTTQQATEASYQVSAQPVPSSTWSTSSQDTDMKNLLWELDEFIKYVSKGEFGDFLKQIMREGDQVKCWEMLKIIRSLKSFMERYRT